MSGTVSKNGGRASGIVGAGAIGADAVGSSNIADDAIDSEHYTDGSIDNAHIADNAINSEHYADGSIDNAHIADDAVDSEHYADGSIDNAHIADDAIDSEHYADGSIDEAHIADNAVTLAKMAGGTDGNIISYDASGDPVAIATGSDGEVLTSTGAGSPPAFEAAAGGGKVLQIQSSLSAATASTTTTIGFDDTIAQNTEGVELVTLAFTPQSTGSKLLFIYGGNFNMGNGGNTIAPAVIALFVDTTANAIAQASATVDGGGTRIMGSWAFHLETNASTSARTYKMRWGCSGQAASTNYINEDSVGNRLFGGKLQSGFYIIEFEN